MALTIIIGPMFAGKTTELIRRITSSNESKLIINHVMDNRYATNHLVTHENFKIPCISLNNIDKIYDIPNLENISEIYIDEAQFFPNLYDTVQSLVINYRKKVIISGLDGDYQMKPFLISRMLELIPIANEIIKLHANCYKCNQPAWYSKRIITSDEQILIGSAEIYQPTCLFHHS